MKVSVQKIRFNGLDFILTNPDESNSPIATVSTFKKGKCSYAHLYKRNSRSEHAGKIMQNLRQIGVVEDIEFGEFVEIEVDPLEVLMGTFGNTWSHNNRHITATVEHSRCSFPLVMLSIDK